jgi:HEAT repeat protein
MIEEPLDINELVEQALQDHGKIRKIVALLYDEDMVRRFAAAKALGEIARREPELMERRWMRIFKSFDDTMSCWGVAEALGEIAMNMPQHRGKITLFLKGFRRDDCSCLGYIWSMCRICQVEKEAIHEFVPVLEEFLQSRNICIRGQTLWALGELRIQNAAGRIKNFLSDEGETWFYENDAVRKDKIKTIAEEALKKIEL